ncbi:hypothetical protein [Nocardia sp. NPDC050406]|uniref:hypothetical protein n=1 Tax=Nocardia sp. NPDC050406 TaxID=3364318 RepID=UPI0037A2471C
MTTLASAIAAHPTELSTTEPRTEPRTHAMFARIFALFSAAGRAVPFHRESSWGLAGSSNVIDRDIQRANAEIRAITSMREHG